MPKRPQTTAELEQHFDDLVTSLHLSCEAFDNGYTGEAKRIATAIRVLVHDTKNSDSLLKQLGKLDGKWWNGAYDDSLYIGIMTFNGLLLTAITENGATYIPMLDEDIPDRGNQFVPFDLWWNQTVMVDKTGTKFTRRDLVLGVSNQDGGAHVDPNLNGNYAALTRENSLNWNFHKNGAVLPLDGPQLPAMRQIGHEVIRTLDPSMPEKPAIRPKGTKALVAAASVSVDSHAKLDHPMVPKVGRNQPCPCGSGKKYKHCYLIAKRASNLAKAR